MIANDSRDADATGRADRLEPGCDVDAIAVQVLLVGDGVANVNAHTEANAAIGWSTVIEFGMRVCISTAKRTADITLANSIISESPAVLAILPPYRAEPERDR